MRGDLTYRALSYFDFSFLCSLSPRTRSGLHPFFRTSLDPPLFSWPGVLSWVCVWLRGGALRALLISHIKGGGGENFFFEPHFYPHLSNEEEVADNYTPSPFHS